VNPPEVGGRTVKDFATARLLSRSVQILNKRAPQRAVPRWWQYAVAGLSCLGLLAPSLDRRAAGSPASTFTILHAFSQTAQIPEAALVLDGNGNAYGTSTGGGTFGYGTVFRLRTDGTGFTLLHSFANGASDGDTPYGSLILDASGLLYGTTEKGGTGNLGTVFKMKTDGSGFTVLHSFAGGNSGGQGPYAALVLDASGFLYGTTFGTPSGASVVFKLKTDGSGFLILHVLAGGANDGIGSQAALLSDGAGNLYGTTYGGGASGLGTVFHVKTDGTGFALLHSFAGGASDGKNPQAALTTDGGGNLYGTTYGGGSSTGAGTVFRLRTNGTGYSLVHAFSGGSDGKSPFFSSVLLDASGFLYGTAVLGGTSGSGTVFKVKTDGTSFTTLHTFTGAPSDGRLPFASVAMDGSGNLYGTTGVGGSADLGTAFTLKTDGTGYALLHRFLNSDGGGLTSSLVLGGGGFLYGTSQGGGASAVGSLFRLKTDGSSFSVLHDFVNSSSDGQQPVSGLLLDASGFLYGTASAGGSGGWGTVFKLKTDGTGYTALHNFGGGASDGKSPQSALIEDGAGFLYGMTLNGGPLDVGTVFKVKTDGTGFALLHKFAGGTQDGSSPYSRLTLDSSGFLYGTTTYGGTSDKGVVFKLRTDGTGFVILRSFAGGASDGAYPRSGLLLDGSGLLYGTSINGGSSPLGQGTVFRLKTDGTGFQLLHAFAGGAQDGAHPFYAGVTADGAGSLYGTTFNGGSVGQGVVYRLRTDGTAFSLLHDFTGSASDGGYAYADLALDGSGNLYGTTALGGFAGSGIVFRLPAGSPPPPTTTPSPTVTPTPTRTPTRAPTSTPPPTRTPNPSGDRFYSVAPCRLIDTRRPDGPLGGPPLQAGAERDFSLASSCGIPPTALAIAGNVTVTGPTSRGSLTLFAAGNPKPATSTINYSAGQTRANNAVVVPNSLDALTVRCTQSSGSVQFILDVTGYFE
jgi:uncharacterized repeat protein (TIGR03803 family)